MKKAIAKKWVAALRSGDYQQGKGRLRNNQDQFCCLGVLCNLHAQAHPKIAAAQTDKNYLTHDAYLPEEVMAWAGMQREDGTIPQRKIRIGETYYTDLACANDQGVTFHQIADAIEQNKDFL